MSSRTLIDRIGSFTAVPNQFIDSAVVGSDAFRVFVYLRRCVNTTNAGETAWPSYETILAACRLGHRRKLAAALKELGDSGWIERHRRFGNSTVYVLKLPSQASEVGATVVPPAGTTETATVVPPAGTIVVPPAGTIVVPPAGTLSRLNEQEEIIKTNRAPAPKRKVVGFTTVITEHADPRVQAYLSTLKSDITDTNAALIMDRVSTDKLQIWQEVLDMWAIHCYRPTNFGGMLERYDTSVNAERIKAKTPIKVQAPQNGRSSMLPQVQDLNSAELDAARARAREQRLARKQQVH